jgi:hypothetical protein
LCFGDFLIEKNKNMKKILSFAINNYPGSGSDLQGCVNDQNNIINILGKEFGFETTWFKDSQVTRNLFRDEVSKLVLSAVNGDIIVIHVSSHGTQLPDVNLDEGDGYDEALYLHDGPFSDDEFSSILFHLKEGVICIFIMDCCFSGTITRDINKKAKFKPLFSEVDGEGYPVEIKFRRSREISSGMNHLVITGCSNLQTSADALISGSYNGALTYAAMKELVPGITYREWHKRTLKWLSSHKYTQTPQLEGPEWMFDLGVFGSTVVKQKKCWLLKLFGKKDSPIKIDKPDNPPKPPIG